MRYEVLIARPADTGLASIGTVEASAPTRFTLSATPAVNEDVDIVVRSISGTGESADAPRQRASGRRDGARPGAPTGLTASEDSNGIVTVSWGVAFDDVAVCEYNLFRNGVLVRSFTSPSSFQDSGLPPGTSVTYSVVARDVLGAGPPSAISLTTAVPRSVPTVGPSATCAYRSTSISAGRAVRSQILLASICLVNYERAKRGIPPLFVDMRLVAAAQSHSEDMVARQYFAHTNPDGCDPTCRARRTGYPSGAGENIFSGPRTAAAAVDGWMESPGHYGNIVTADYWTVGVGGAFDSGAMWTHTFGFEAPTADAVSGLEPRFQGAADPTRGMSEDPVDSGVKREPRLTPAAKAPVRLVRIAARSRGRLLTITGRATRAGVRVFITVRRGSKKRSAVGRVRANRTFKTKALAPRGRGRVRVTVRVGKSQGTIRLK